MSKERFITPFAECLYPFLQEAKHDPEGDYEDAFEITLVLDHKEHAELLKQIGQLYKDAGGTVKMGEKYHPIKRHYIKEQATEDGKTIERKKYIDNKYQVRFKTKAEFVDHIVCFDSQGKVVWKEKNFVANGSIVRVNWSYGFFNNKGNKGVSLFLNYIQIKELIEWTGSVDFESSGFDKTEGYESGDVVDIAEPPDNIPMSDEDLTGQDGSLVEDDLPF